MKPFAHEDDLRAPLIDVEKMLDAMTPEQRREMFGQYARAQAVGQWLLGKDKPDACTRAIALCDELLDWTRCEIKQTWWQRICMRIHRLRN